MSGSWFDKTMDLLFVHLNLLRHFTKNKLRQKFQVKRVSTTVSALIQCANSIFQNDYLGRTQFKFWPNLRILFKKFAQKLDFCPENEQCAVN